MASIGAGNKKRKRPTNSPQSADRPNKKRPGQRPKHDTLSLDASPPLQAVDRPVLDRLPMASLAAPPLDIVLEELKVQYDRERSLHVDPVSLSKHPKINAHHRAILADWLIEVAHEYGLGRSTLHLAVSHVDRFLSLNVHADRSDGLRLITGSNFQLLGITALYLAGKQEEVLPPNAAQCALVTDGAFTARQLVKMEKCILQSLEWRILPRTSYAFLLTYLYILWVEIHRLRWPSTETAMVTAAAAAIEQLLRTRTFERMMELLDGAIVDASFLRYYPSAHAAAVLCVMCTEELQLPRVVFDWLAHLMEAITEYRQSDLAACINDLRRLAAVLPQRQGPPLNGAMLVDLKVN